MRLVPLLCFAVATSLWAPTGAFAQQARIVAIPADAKRAVMVFAGSPDIALDGRAARLSPGARIFDRNNYLQMSGAMHGSFVVKYQLEPLSGLVHVVWILTDEEIARSNAQ